ncbi:MFS transporter [Leptobacterium sp. I13]|uniref:MFS transporter n=1 Tax=Leptobacterium meishanense TaxID=3128904 RepID=UPI0030EFA3ED
MLPSKKWILPVIVIAQFLCTSVWFAGNAVIKGLINDYGLNKNDLGDIVAAVQFGFISGTLIYAFFNVADRFSPSKVFMVSAFLGVLANISIISNHQTFTSILTFRFLTGFFLAGIYPVGMKIAADYYEKGLGKALGFLVGALVIGTAFPHLLNSFSGYISWKAVIIYTSALCFLGGFSVGFFIKNGPYRKASQKFNIIVLFSVFKDIAFRKAAYGYFGHMWELYAFWTFVPIILTTYINIHGNDINVPLWSFMIIAIGSIACIAGGYISLKKGIKKTALKALLLSGFCCLVSPFMFLVASPIIFILFLLFWGMVVIADSPLFSTMVAQNAIPQYKGTALTIVNCIGFAVTIISIQLIQEMIKYIPSTYLYLLLVPGPVFGVLSLYMKKIRV